jgi:hypothetical protein
MNPAELPSDMSDSRERSLRDSAAAFVQAELALGDAGDIGEETFSDSEASETSLRALFRALPSPVPGIDFAARVMAFVPVRRVRRRVRDLAPRHRWLVAAAALCTALASAYVLPLAVLVLGQVEWGALLASFGAGFGHLVSVLYALYGFVLLFARSAVSLLNAFWLFLSSPQVLLTLVLATSVVGLCLRLLTGLIHSPRDPAHASL